MLAPTLALLAAAAQTPTQLTLVVAPGLDPVYSDAVLASVTLTDGAGGVADQRVDFFLTSAEHSISCTPGSLLATGADGTAGPLRIRFVDGAYGVSHFVAADDTGVAYTLEARFPGDASYQPATAEATLHLLREVVTVRVLPEHSAEVGEVLDLVATLVDENGDAEEGGSGTTGRVEKPIAGAQLHFFLDLNDDSDFGDADESLGAFETGASGTATVAFDTTPVAGLPRAGFHRDAVRVEFAGDDRYKRAAGLGDLRLLPTAVDPQRTVLTATPEEAPADGVAVVDIDAQLLDLNGSPFGPDDDPHEVAFATSAGELLESAARDPATGHYVQQLQAPRSEGTAEVSVSVDGEQGPSVEVVFTPYGCGCSGAGSSSSLLVLLALCHRRRR